MGFIKNIMIIGAFLFVLAHLAEFLVMYIAFILFLAAFSTVAAVKFF